MGILEKFIYKYFHDKCMIYRHTRILIYSTTQGMGPSPVQVGSVYFVTLYVSKQLLAKFVSQYVI